MDINVLVAQLFANKFEYTTPKGQLALNRRDTFQRHLMSCFGRSKLMVARPLHIQEFGHMRKWDGRTEENCKCTSDPTTSDAVTS